MPSCPPKREAQKTSIFSGVTDFISQDFMVTESMGPIYDRTSEHLGTTDMLVIASRRALINAAKALREKGETSRPQLPAELLIRWAIRSALDQSASVHAARRSSHCDCRREMKLR